ncbi:MAG TPA: DUF4145 domain-containing protein [Cytophagaceae bacterium]|jgi:hypothetical protein|nr:DUF4145 domain-containing protein [Cytophagaceae bacterium]
MDELLKCECRDCMKETNHQVLHKTEAFFTEENSTEKGIYMIVQCCGCDTVGFYLEERDMYLGFESTEEEEYSIGYTYPGYDEYEDFDFLKYDDQYSLPKNICEKYDEMKDAFKNNSLTLAGIALRIILENICIDQKVDGGNLIEKIKNLNTAGLISTNEIETLDKVRVIGNASAHGIKSTKMEYLEYALGIINHVLLSIYILPKLNKKLSKIPKKINN